AEVRAAASRRGAETLAIREGRIIDGGEAAGAQRVVGRATTVLEPGGRIVLPGFHDTHAHPLSGGLELGECNLYEARTPAEVEGAIRACVAARPEGPWIRGNGRQLPVLPAANPNTPP